MAYKFEKELKKDQQAFNKRLPKLLKGPHKGEAVLFRNGKIVSYHKDANDAYVAGLKRFGTEKHFLIDYIDEHFPIYIYHSGVSNVNQG